MRRSFFSIIALVLVIAAGARCFAAKKAAEPVAALSPEEDEARLKVAYAEVLGRIDRPAEDVVVPVECYESGAVKIDVTAARAQFFDAEGLVWCGDVTVREYGLDGEVKLELDAKSCIVDRKSRSGWLEGDAEGRFGKTVLSGRGIYFSYKDEYVKISSGVSIISSDIKFEGVKL